MTSRLTLVNAQPAAAFLDNDVCVVAKTLCLTAQSRWKRLWVRGSLGRSCGALRWWCSQRRSRSYLLHRARHPERLLGRRCPDEGVAAPPGRLAPVGRGLRLPNAIVSASHVRAPVAFLHISMCLRLTFSAANRRSRLLSTVSSRSPALHANCGTARSSASSMSAVVVVSVSGLRRVGAHQRPRAPTVPLEARVTATWKGFAPVGRGWLLLAKAVVSMRHLSAPSLLKAPSFFFSSRPRKPTPGHDRNGGAAWPDAGVQYTSAGVSRT